MKHEPLNILLVDPDEGAAQRIDLLLQRAQSYIFNLDIVTNNPDAEARLKEKHYDVCLVAHELLLPDTSDLSPEAAMEMIIGENSERTTSQRFWRKMVEERHSGLIVLFTSQKKVYRTTIYGIAQTMLNHSLDAIVEAVHASDVLTKWNFDSVDLERILGLVARQRQEVAELKTERDALHHRYMVIKAMLEGQSILNAIDRKLGYSIAVDQVLELTMNTLSTRTGAAACTVSWIESGTRQLHALSRSGKGLLFPNDQRLDELETENSPLSQVFRPQNQGAPIINREKNWLLLPLYIHDQTQGVIILEDIDPQHFEELDVGFLRHLAERMAVALDNAQVHRRAQTYGEYMERLYGVSTMIASTLNEDELLDIGTRGFSVLLNSSSVMCCIYNARQHKMIVSNVFINAGMTESLPPINARFDTDAYPQLAEGLNRGPIPMRVTSDVLNDPERELMLMLGIQSVLVVPLLADGEVVGIFAACESRYERYWQEDEIALARSLGSQLSVAYQQARLFTSVQTLEQTKTEMIRMTSHDLKNPLQQIMGYVDLLRLDAASVLSEDHQNYLVNIYKAARKIEGLAEDILNLERAESDPESDWKPLILQEILTEVYDGLIPQAQLKKQTLTAAISSQTALVRGSDYLLRQAFVNLIGNAIKYTPDGGAISVHLQTEGSEFVRFHVTDNGYGIPKERQDRLFQSFYRANTPGTSHISGTGLGLSTVKTIVERHDGEVWFQSELGAGSTFGFWLPLMSNSHPTG